MIGKIISLAVVAIGLFFVARSMERRIQRQEYEATKVGFEATMRMIDVDLAKMNHELEDLL